MIRLSLISAILVAAAPHMWGQQFIREVSTIPCTVSGTSLTLPFAGGINTPNHQFIDIDSDGDQDVFVFDSDLTPTFYRNVGSATSPSFQLDNNAITLPPFAIWYLFLDFDGDGLVDLLTEDSLFTGIHVYKNIGTSQSPLFSSLVSTLLDTSGASVFAGQSSIPAFSDIDGDGDQDFFSSNFSGSINFYRNVGSAVNPQFSFVSGDWEGILLFGDSCLTSSPKRVQHGASAYRFADIDGDGDNDFFAGDVFWNGIFSVKNLGTPSLPDMRCETSYFPLNQPLLTNGLNQTSFVDIDGDGDHDMFVGTLGGLTQTNGFVFYRNQGSPTNPILQREPETLFSMVDAGLNVHPRFVDIDGDVDADLFIGNLNGQIYFFRNVGTTTAPSFDQTDTIYQQISGGFGFAPAFGDVDADGDYDLLVGKFDGRVAFYRNTGSASSAVFIPESSIVDNINVTNWNTPALVDIDADGDLDLFMGRSNGRITFYRNLGSPTNFQPVLENTTYENISAGLNSVPAFLDWDSDGDFDLFVGTSEGRVEFYRNIGTNTMAQFIRETNHFANTERMTEASPGIVDINGDGFPDLFVGTSKGGIHYYRNTGSSSAELSESAPGTFSLSQNYPNPFNPATTIRFSLTAPARITLSVYDILGHKVAILADGLHNAGDNVVPFSGASLATGTYYYRLSSPGQTAVRMMILLK